MANARANGLDPDAREHVAADVFDWLKRAAKRGQRFGLVVLDPPSFATTRTSRFTAASGYADLVAAAAPLVEPGGELLACCNLTGLTPDQFEAKVLRGLAKAGRSAEVTKAFGASAIDYPPPSAFKAVLVTL